MVGAAAAAAASEDRERETKGHGAGRHEAQVGESGVQAGGGEREPAGGGAVGERDRRHLEVPGGVRRGPPLATHRLRGFHQVLAREAPSPHLPVCGRSLPSSPAVPGSSLLPGRFNHLFLSCNLATAKGSVVDCLLLC